LSDVISLLGNLADLPRAELRAGSAIIAWFRDQAGSAPCTDGGLSLIGIPIVLDNTRGSNRWQYRENGETVRDGCVGPDDRPVWYVPGRGFLTFRDPMPEGC
jgi:hypothetical protein